MIESIIRFEGESFHAIKWYKLLQDLGLQVVGGFPEKALYSASGNSIVGVTIGFVDYESFHGYEWTFNLKQSRRWEGYIKFYAILLASFSVPQEATVIVGGSEFRSYDSLRDFAEKSLLNDFDLDELIDHRIFIENDGIQFI